MRFGAGVAALERYANILPLGNLKNGGSLIGAAENQPFESNWNDRRLLFFLVLPRCGLLSV
jgi:hypothetical protein